MPFAVNLAFDTASAATIEQLYADVVAIGVAERDVVSQYGPCATILVLSDVVSAASVIRLLEWKLAGMSAIPVLLTEPCIILGTPPTLGVRLDPGEALLALHDALYTEMPEADVHLHYRPAYWQPHVKLANVPGDRAWGEALRERLSAAWHPVRGVLDRIEAVQYSPVQSIWQAPLRRPTHPG